MEINWWKNTESELESFSACNQGTLYFSARKIEAFGIFPYWSLAYRFKTFQGGAFEIKNIIAVETKEDVFIKAEQTLASKRLEIQMVEKGSQII